MNYTLEMRERKNERGLFVSYDETFLEKTAPTRATWAVLNRNDSCVDQQTRLAEMRREKRATRNKLKFNI